MQSLGGQSMGFDQAIERHQREGGGPDLNGKGRDTERHAFTGEPLSLTVEGLVLAVLLKEQHGEKAWSGRSARHHVEWCWRLCDLLAVAAGELLANRLNDLPRAGDHFERLGHILSQLRETVAAACGA
ncbi:hypothetical protein A9995_15660 [Erythrobacter sp. QSSC1-22B]|nr:hypothetical protein A9995_15660 [Erythrobacter sp. QSSC1-22B]